VGVSSSGQTSSTSLHQEAHLKAGNSLAGDQFGFTVATEGALLVVGAPAEDSGETPGDGSAEDSGAVYVFWRGETAPWGAPYYLKRPSPGPARSDWFGFSVAVSEGVIYVGAPGVDGKGAAYAFQVSNGIWDGTPLVPPPHYPIDSGDRYGASISAWKGTVVVGAPGEDSRAVGVNGFHENELADSGAAYVFTGMASFHSYLKASNTDSGDRFGAAVSVRRSVILVGAPEEASAATGTGADQDDNSLPGAGAAYIFENPDDAGWSQGAYLKPNQNPNRHAFHFGASVAVGIGAVVVGAPGESGEKPGPNAQPIGFDAPGSGSAHVFFRPTTGVPYVQCAYLKADVVSPLDSFGTSLSLDDSWNLLVGAPGDHSGSAGVNPARTGFRPGAGAAYLFRAPSFTGPWTQHSYIKASNTGADDQFGLAVAQDSLGSGTLAVGAPGEDSAGVLNPPDNNDAEDSGSVYVFR
jgi:hypothetical protein